MSGGNAQKTPYGLSANKIARNRAEDRIQLTGRDYPCSVTKVEGQIVTVKFEIQTSNPQTTLPNVKMPIATSAYDWIPVQVGDKGLAKASDAYLGGISGLGDGVADLSPRGNLSALVFHPSSNSSWTPGGGASGDMRVITGPGGVLVFAGDSKFKITGSEITMTAGGKTLSIGAAGITLDGILFDTHEHTLVTIGEENSGPPTSP